MQHTPTVAVVILNWNGKAFLEQFVPSVLASTYPELQIIVADNASTDDSVLFLKAKFPQVQVLQSPENYGFAKGYNFFLQQVKADYYVLLNSDVEVTPGWIEPIVAFMEKNDRIAACQPKLLSYHNKQEFEYAGGAGGWIDALGYPFSRGRVFARLETDHGQYNTNEPIFWASGAAMFVKAQLFHQMEGFDSFFFAHQEEIDLCWRLQRNGYQIYACPQSVVYHVGAGTLPSGSERKVFLNFRNNLIMLTKNLPANQLIWIIPARFVLDAVSAWKQLLQGQPVYWKAVVTSHLAYLKWLLGKKQVVKAPYPELEGWFKGSIVWEYFVRGKHHFSEIVKRK